MANKSDLDFDELDKAVSSLMGKVGSETLEEGGKTKTLAINETLQPDEKPKYAEIDQLAKTIGNETLVTDAEIELTADLDTAPHAPVSDGTQPSVDVPTETTVPQAQEEVIESPTPPMIKPVAPRPNSGRFMDVVHPTGDMRSNATAQQTKPLASVSVPPSPITTPSPAATPQKAMDISPHFIDTPIVSPFIPDAKVEKRPLGAQAQEPLSSEVSSTPQPTEEISGRFDIAHDSDEATQEDVPANEPVHDVQRPVNPEDTSANNPDTEKQLHEIEASDVQVATQPDVQQTSQPLQAPAQDTTTTAVESGSIYDTTTYHQGVSHPQKQKSGWGVVVIIIVIILIAAGAAAGAYFFLGLQG